MMRRVEIHVIDRDRLRLRPDGTLLAQGGAGAAGLRCADAPRQRPGRRRARPLTSRIAVIESITATTTTTGRTVECELDSADYPKGIKVSGAELKAIALIGDAFHPEWNYIISPRNQDRAVILALNLICYVLTAPRI
jgi:Rhodopirellula transposase DDE domain